MIGANFVEQKFWNCMMLVMGGGEGECHKHWRCLLFSSKSFFVEF